ncbi:hypothetical protein GGI07_004237 [Coemansia sp. Benny D115]|nr:hypothetical protein GGI07_004237 [Coemansia sp. Benny D115]
MTAQETQTTRLMRLECGYRAYIGFTWFYRHSDTLMAADAAAQCLQQGVDRVVGANPILGGLLAETPNSNQVEVRYTLPPCAAARCEITPQAVPYTYRQLEEAAFDQNKFPEIFGAISSTRPSIQGLRVFDVRLLVLECGSLAVTLQVYHTVADAKAVVCIAGGIAKACRSDGPVLEMWHDRAPLRALLLPATEGQHAEGLGAGVSVSRSPLEEHLHQIGQDIPGSKRPDRLEGVAQAQCRRCQIALSADSLAALKSTSSSSDVPLSTNDLVMALLWRAWTRTLIRLGSQAHTYSYFGGPVDMRAKAQASISDRNMDLYLGNLILPLPIYDSKDAVTQGTLVQVAEHIHQHMHAASLSALQQLSQAAELGLPDIVQTLAEGDSPAMGFSNMTRFDVYAVDFGLDASRARCSNVQMRSFDALLMVFAVADGCGGVLANTSLPPAVADVLVGDDELRKYAYFTY